MFAEMTYPDKSVYFAKMIKKYDILETPQTPNDKQQKQENLTLHVNIVLPIEVCIEIYHFFNHNVYIKRFSRYTFQKKQDLTHKGL